MKRNKKGSISDGAVIAIMLFGLALTIIVSYVIISDVNDAVQASDTFDATAKNVSSGLKTGFLEMADGFILVALIALGIGVFVSASLLNTHPFFFIAGVVVMGIVVTIGAVLSNAYEEFASDPAISSYANDFTILPFIFQNYPFIMVGLGALLIIGLFAKNRGVEA